MQTTKNYTPATIGNGKAVHVGRRHYSVKGAEFPLTEMLCTTTAYSGQTANMAESGTEVTCKRCLKLAAAKVISTK